MLVRHRLLQFVTFLGMTTLLNSTLVLGQGPFMDPNQYYSAGGNQFSAPESYQNPQALYPPGNPQLQPYPGIDMYRWDQQQTKIENGIWTQRLIPHDVVYKTNLDFIYSYFGEPGRRMYGYGAGFDAEYYGTGWIDISNHAARINVNSNSTSNDALQEVGVGTQVQDLGKAFINDSERPGVRLSWAMSTQTGSEFEINGFWTENKNESFFRGQDPSFFANGQFQLDTLDMLNPVISLDLGNGLATFVPFDEFYQLSWNTQSWGTGATFLSAPIIENDTYRIRPVLGARYVRVNERLAFKGQDSGTEYRYQLYTGSDSITDSVGGVIIIGSGIAPGRPITPPIGPPLNSALTPFLPVDQYRVEIESSIDTNLAGPEIGLRLDAGEGKFMKAFIQTNFGLLVNQQSQDLRSRGVGNYFFDNDGNGIQDGLDTGNGLRENVNTDSNDHTTISPMVEFSANLEMDLFKHLPIINKWEISDDTLLRIGFSYLYVANFARTSDNTDFYAYPNAPKLNGNREHWDLTTFNFGITKQF